MKTEQRKCVEKATGSWSLRFDYLRYSVYTYNVPLYTHHVQSCQGGRSKRDETVPLSWGLFLHLFTSTRHPTKKQGLAKKRLE